MSFSNNSRQSEKGGPEHFEFGNIIILILNIKNRVRVVFVCVSSLFAMNP